VPPSDQIDADWVRGAVDQYERPLRLYAARLLHGDRDRAKDVVQDAFLRLCDQSRGDIGDHLAQWLYTVCRNLALNINRKEKRMTEMSDAQQRLRPSQTPGPDDVTQQRDEQSRAMALIDGLPEHQQEVIRLKFQHGLTYRQIAKITDQPVSTVNYLVHAGLAAVRKQMTPPGAGGVLEKKDEVTK
jgi:RNA polymerase sigma-70 factor (ECF subfamily)